MWLGFEWDPDKAESNLAKHGVSFESAITVFNDPLSRTIPDPEHSDYENRFITMGTSSAGELLVVCNLDRGDRGVPDLLCRWMS
jgi:uncharacterized DUF497 family protein